jgi:hypothetical protein
MSSASLPYFTVSGGPFAKAQTMGWHVVNERGFTVAVSCDDEFAKRLNALESVAAMLRRMDAVYHLRERRDDGYLQLDDELWENWKKLVSLLRLEDPLGAQSDGDST